MPDLITPPCLQVPSFAHPRITHGFFGRDGGISTGLYASLNCGPGSDDRAEAVVTNRARVASAMGVPPDHLMTLYQVHSGDVVVVDRPWPADRPKADALVSTMPGLALGVLTADCLPVLFHDAERRVIAAAHGGWRGVMANILENTVARMVDCGAQADQIEAVIGPAISQTHYEVGPEFFLSVVGQDARAEAFFTAADDQNKRHFDLPHYAVARLQRLGLNAVQNIDRCTYGRADLFSYRQSQHQGAPDYGRNIACIALQA